MNMEQKRVTFEVAKALKEAGYSQGFQLGEAYYNQYGEIQYYTEDMVLGSNICDAPYVTDAWRWLWREKNIYVQVGLKCCTLSFPHVDSCTFKLTTDPEEAIEAAIDYIVDNNLLK